MKDYKVGDIVKTLDGDFKIVEIMNLINPFTFNEEKGIIVDYNGVERKINNERIIE